MTENLLHKLEEKMLMLISEVEELRKEIQRLTTENVSLKNKEDTHLKKVQELILLLDSISIIGEAPLSGSATSIAA